MLLFAAVLLASCQTITTGPSKDKSPLASVRSLRAQDDLQGLVGFAAWLQQQPPENLVQIAPELADKAAAPGTAEDRIRLALFLGLPDSPFSDAREARRLLTEVLADSTESTDGISEFVRVVLTYLNDQDQLRASLEHQVEEEHDAREQLQYKLDELKTIEEQLSKRDAAKRTNSHD